MKWESKWKTTCSYSKRKIKKISRIYDVQYRTKRGILLPVKTRKGPRRKSRKNRFRLMWGETDHSVVDKLVLGKILCQKFLWSTFVRQHGKACNKKESDNVILISDERKIITKLYKTNHRFPNQFSTYQDKKKTFYNKEITKYQFSIIGNRQYVKFLWKD